VHQLNAPFWSEDLSDAGPDDYDRDGYDPYDPYLDILPERRPDYDSDFDEDGENFSWALYIDDDDEPDTDDPESGKPELPAEDREPKWSLKLALTKGQGDKTQTFYNQMHQKPQDLYWSLMEWFEPEDDEYDDEFDDDELDDEENIDGTNNDCGS